MAQGPPLTSSSVSVTNLPATQNVSGTVTVSNLSGLTLSGTVAVSNFPATQPVSGTFWQATQPVSGTFFQATQPVSAASLPLPAGAATAAGQAALHVDGGALTHVTNFPATQPVSGTFWQATQPVSGTVALGSGSAAIGSVSVSNLPATQAVSIASMPSTPVTGTFFQATQPVSGTFWQATQPVSGTFWQATQPVSVPTLAKGTQGATGLSVQQLIDAGRNVSTLFMVLPIVTTATDALMSLTGYKANAAVAATTTPAVVTSGKTYRITSIVMTYVAIATAGSAKFTLRANAGGVVAIGSPAVANWIVGGPAAVAGVASTLTVDIDGGLEFPAGAGIGISMVGLGATQSAAAVGYGSVTICGFEY